MPALEARGQGVLASCEAAPWVINASQGLRMEKALRACSHPPQTALNSGQPLVRPRWEMSQEPGAPWRAPALHNGDASPGSWPGCICGAGWRYVSHPTAAACLCPASSPGTTTPDPPAAPTATSHPQCPGHGEPHGAVPGAPTGLAATPWAEHPPPAHGDGQHPTSQPNISTSLRTHGPFLVLFNLVDGCRVLSSARSRGAEPGATSQPFFLRVPAAGTAACICTAVPLTKYLNISSFFFFFFHY